MALFKIYKGLSNNLKNTPNPQKENVTQLTKEGHCYFTTDDGKFYIDIVNNVTPIYPNADGSNFAEVTRMPINAFKADRAAIAEWSARALADVNGNDIHTHYGHSLGIDGYKLKLIAADTTNLVLSEITLPSNVETAKKFTSNQTIKLTGAVTGEKSSQAGWEIATTLATGIVTTSKIAASAVTNAKIANGAVSNSKIANATIENAKLVNSSITIGGKSVSLGGSLTLADIGLSSALRFIGATTTAIVDGGTTSPISINGSNVTPAIGDVVINSNNNQEYVWLGTKWELLGDESSYSLKGHTHTVTYAKSATATGSTTQGGTNAETSITPAGTVSQPTFTGTAHNHKFTGTAHSHTFTGSSHNHTLTPTTTNVYSITSVGTMFAASVSGEVLTLTPGTAPTRSSVIKAYTGLTIAAATQGGTIANTTATGTIANTTATGTVSKPTFTGTAAKHTHTFTGSEHTHAITLTNATVTSST